MDDMERTALLAMTDQWIMDAKKCAARIIEAADTARFLGLNDLNARAWIIGHVDELTASLGPDQIVPATQALAVELAIMCADKAANR